MISWVKSAQRKRKEQREDPCIGGDDPCSSWSLRQRHQLYKAVGDSIHFTVQGVLTSITQARKSVEWETVWVEGGRGLKKKRKEIAK